MLVFTAYVKTSQDHRLHISGEDFHKVWLAIQDRYLAEKQVDPTLQVNIEGMHPMQGRGIIIASDETSAQWYEDNIHQVKIQDRTFKAWISREASTVLVTVIVKDKGYTPEDKCIHYLRICNDMRVGNFTNSSAKRTPRMPPG